MRIIRAMKLIEYMKKYGINHQQFAESIGVQSVAIYRYLSGIRTPNKKILLKIYNITNGKVTPNDILNIPPKDAGGADE